MQTIITKYLGTSSRIKATHSGRFTSVLMSYDHNLSSEENHTAAAEALAAKLGWEGDYIGGHNGGDGMFFVNATPIYSFTATRKAEAA